MVSPLPSSPLDRRQLAWRAQLALVEVLSADLGARALARLSFWLCRLVALGYLGAIFWSVRAHTDATLILVRQGVQVLSWLAGIAALAVAGSGSGSAKPHQGLLRLRGIGAIQEGNAEWTAATAVVFKVALPPSLSLALLPLLMSDRWALLPRTALLTLGVGVYVICLSLILGISAHFARELSPRRGRLLLLSVYLLPLLLSQALPLPSLPALLADLLRYCLSFGLR